MSDDPSVPDKDEQSARDHVLHAPGISIETTDIGYDRLKGDRRAPPRLRRIDIVVLLLLLLATGLTRFIRLSDPGAVLPASDPTCTASPPIGKTCYEPIPTDEVHYIPDARDVLRYGTESDSRVSAEDGPYIVHPPVAKWFIAAGMRIFGDRPFGWRFFGALFGTFSVLIMYLLALRLWGSPWWAAAAGTLLAADGLWFMQSRTAMLDIYVAVFVLAGIWLLVVDRDVTQPDHRGFRWWRVAAGAMFGLAIASKWDALPFIAVGIASTMAWDAVRARDAADRRYAAKIAGTLGALVLLPIAIYIASYTPWFVDSHRYNLPQCSKETTTFSFGVYHLGGLAGQWLCYQHEVYNFHANLQKYVPTTDPTTGKTVKTPGHPYYGNAWTWPWIGRPVAHYYQSTGSGSKQLDSEILGLPNPMIWWPSFFIGFIALAWWTYKKDTTASFIFSLFVAGWFPFLILGDALGKPVFMFYATPLVPYVVLTLVHVLYRSVRRWPQLTPYVVGYVVACVGAFAYFYPILAALPIPYNGAFGWARHIWFSDRFHFFKIKGDCSVPNKIKLLCWI
ncbi:MAG: phospholipid carrier-dependent glycosyltransferase [Actinobacteria bacterium]|nr:MAG: phospholipid carrier-dependent glycosyltransferase [Actinomycetota bacterium]